ncbi:hypothetical protein DPMN_016606 [Dreissena polymorpha]|uniref:Uncharacterized protein n=1 Tax=Dreissena polymorpha TaxID=45954 RepID=A0A9D4NA01_DREPO|nr:hypothetical protein DPMN_016606 [Dreissena polymorpha]
MWTDGRLTKTNPKTSLEQSGELKSVKTTPWRPYTYKTNLFTKFHDDWANNVTSRKFTSHVIQMTGTIFELNSRIKETIVMTKFQEHWAKDVTSRVFTYFHYLPGV